MREARRYPAGGMTNAPAAGVHAKNANGAARRMTDGRATDEPSARQKLYLPRTPNTAPSCMKRECEPARTGVSKLCEKYSSSKMLRP